MGAAFNSGVLQNLPDLAPQYTSCYGAPVFQTLVILFLLSIPKFKKLIGNSEFMLTVPFGVTMEAV